MATFRSKYTNEQIEATLDRARVQDTVPFVMFYDSSDKVYRFFPDAEKRDIWSTARDNGEMTAEIKAYEFTLNFAAPAPYKLDITLDTETKYNIPYNSTGNTLKYTFATFKDGATTPTQEDVDVYYTFKSGSTSTQFSKVYSYGTTVEMTIDDYLKLGTNSITILVSGRTTGTTNTIVVVLNVVQLEIESTFDISKAQEPYENIDVTYTVRGSRNKTIKFYIDGEHKKTDSVSDLQSEKTTTIALDGLSPGKHSLQIQASNDITDFHSTLLYYEFVVAGVEQTVVLLEHEFPSSQTVFSGMSPGLNGEQYVVTKLDWAYFSSDPEKSTATITWRLWTAGGVETTLATRKADILVAGTGIMPEPLSFIPTEYGDYNLQAIIEDDSGTIEINGTNYTSIGDFTITVAKNTSGIEENTSGMTMKLTGLGRSNDEPSDTRSSWSCTYLGTTTNATFLNQPWNSNSGWNEDALWLNNGATCVINHQPFSEKVAAQSKNGMVFEIDFETFNIDDDDAEVLRIGQSNGMSLVITSNKATLTSNLGYDLVAQFKSDERVKLAFIVYPNSTGSYPQMMFIQSNGVLSQGKKYGKTDTFITDDTIHLGNAESKAGIKIYYIRTYSIAYSMYDGLTNYIIDSGEDIDELVKKNDIYSTGTHSIDMDKLESTIATVKITADIQSLIDTESKVTVYGGLEVVIPSDPDRNFWCDNAEFKNAGQSTLGLPVPSMHVKLDKNGNQCYRTTDNKALVKNRWAFRSENAPEKKFRLQANYMESSGCHNGAFLRMFNQVAPKVQVDGKFVLRTPAQDFVLDKSSDGYSKKMEAKYGEDPSGKSWAFPYTLNMVPDSIPAIVIWRPDSSSSYRFLGQYVIMEEKKSNFTGCQRSIYDSKDADGNPDPFEFSSSGGNRLWDNSSCMQFEILRSSEDLTLFLDDSNFSQSAREYAFEMIYPDPDDLTAAEIETCWQTFKNEFIHPIVACRTTGSTDAEHQAAFDALYSSGLFDRYQWAAYYCLMLRNCCVDSSVRNMEITTYKTTTINGQTKHVWLPKWWDNDMQCGVQQSGECNVQPRSDRTTRFDGTNTFVFAGRSYDESGNLRSSWLWDALEGCSQFMDDVKVIDEQLYQNLWRYKNMTELQDEEYIDAWSQSLYNESGVVKYINYDHLLNLQGDRTAHRHWFLRTNYNYFDAKNVCGEYKGLASHMRTQGTTTGYTMKFKSAATSYFGWGTTQDIVSSGIYKEKGTSFEIPINIGSSVLQYNDPIQLYSSSNYETIDLSEIAKFLYGDVNFHNTYDSVNGSKLKTLNIGIPWSDMHPTTGDLSSGVFNNYTGLAEGIYLDGAETDSETKEVTYYYMNRLEDLNIQGLHAVESLDISGLTSLKKYSAVGTQITLFNPANGVSMTDVKLPSTIQSIDADGCSFSDGSGNCTISWWKTLYKDVYDSTTKETITVPCNVEEISIPYTIDEIKLTAMGKDQGARQLFTTWISAISGYAESQETPANVYRTKQFTVSDVYWTNFDVNILLTMAKIPAGNRTLTGYIKCNTELTSEQMNTLMDAFGNNIFTITNNLKIDCDSTNIIVSATGSETTVVKETLVVDGVSKEYDVIHIKQGSTANFKSIGFPITISGITYNWGMYANYQDSMSTKRVGTSSNPKIYFGYNEGEHIFNNIEYNTGILTSEECRSNQDLYYRVYVIGTPGGGVGNAFIKIVERTYPTSVSIDITSTPKPTKVGNTYQILNEDTYTIDASHTPNTYTGTLSATNGGVWTVDNYNTNYITRTAAIESDELGEFERYKLNVHTLPSDEHTIKFHYISTWKDGTELSASPLEITLVGVINDVLTISANEALFKAVQQHGVEHSSQYSYSSFDLKKATGVLHFKKLLEDCSTPVSIFRSTYNNEYNVLNYMRNTNGLDFSGCSYLEQDIDIAGMMNFTSLNLSGTSINADIGTSTFLTELYYGSPSEINIIKPSSSLYASKVGVESTRLNLETLKIDSIKDNNSFWLASSILSGGYDVLTTLFVNQSQNVTETVQGYDIERLANIVRTRKSYFTTNTALSGHICAAHMYEDSQDLLNEEFDGLTVSQLAGYATSSDYYVRWNDNVFLTYMSQNGNAVGGDGTGITYGNAKNLVNESNGNLNGLIRDKTNIHDLSDLNICENLSFPDCENARESDFAGCTGITKLTMPKNISKVGSYTFVGLANLYQLSFNGCSKLESINDNSFIGCSNDRIEINLTDCEKLEYANLSGFSNAKFIVADTLPVFETLII